MYSFCTTFCDNVFCTWVQTFHVALDTSSVLGLTHFMLRRTRLLYFGGHIACYVGHVFCTSVETLHVTLVTSSVPRFAHFLLRSASWNEGKRRAGAVAKRKTIQKNVTFFEGVQHTFFSCHCSKTMIFARSHNCDAK